ncbi:MAG: CHAT domain-containing protein, partial [Cocleimonas sp.]|nr:CHAT domain-containing protein [Cocleimonas sp.]
MNTKPLILLIFANDQKAYLDGVRKERKNLINLLKPVTDKIGLELKEIDYSSIEGVIDLLNIQRERLVMLHFAGHSGTDLLRLDEGNAHSGGLADKLSKCPNLKLVFLNGCDNTNLIKAIVLAGIPNVIGTKQAIVDKTAQQFSHGFYQALVTQSNAVTPSFEQAISDVEMQNGEVSRSLDLSELAGDQSWAWFIESSEPHWRLIDAATPCNRLPSIQRNELPQKPFKNLSYYTSADAEIFFGRCQELVDVLNILDTSKEPLLLLHGGTGVGKSSFLLAGLIPRLQSSLRNQVVRCIRYSTSNSPTDSLKELFGTSIIKDIKKKINTIEKNDFPSIWIIDQLEEVFFDKEGSNSVYIPSALKKLLSTLHSILYPSDGTNRPNIKIILCLRKEWFADLYDACNEYKINLHNYLLRPLDKLSIMEVIETPSELSHLKQHYRLSIKNPEDGELSEQIADDLLVDKQSNIAPTLQIILSRLWDRVISQHDRTWDEALYLDEKQSGLLLENHLSLQLDDIANKEKWGAEAKESGLLLDVLHAHTTEQSTSGTLTFQEYEIFYSHISYRSSLLKVLKDRYLIIEPQTNALSDKQQKTRLAHDTLAQLIKTNFEKSELVGQKARKALDNRKINWKKENNKFIGVALDSYDLKIIIEGQFGTTNWKKNALEEAIINSSKKKQRIRFIKNLLLSVVITSISIFILWFIIKVYIKDNQYVVNNVSSSYDSLLIKFLAKEKIKLSDIDYLIKTLTSTDSNAISERHNIAKNTILSSLYLLRSYINKMSISDAKKSLRFSLDNEKLIVSYGLDKDFIKYYKDKGLIAENRYYFTLFLIIESTSILYC